MAEGGDTGLLYVLCAAAAVGVLTDVILLVWQLMTYNLERGFRFVKAALILFDLFYALTGVAVILLLLYQDVAALFLCKAGGFLILFASQETVWLLATCAVALLLWKRKSLSRDFQRRNVAIFALIAGAQGMVLLTISFLPFTNIHYFDDISDYYFRCTPLRLPGEQGWAFSTLVIVLNWIVIGVAVVTLTVVSVRYSKCTEPELSPAGNLLETVTSNKRLQRQIFLALCIASGGWILTHILVCASYFAKGTIDKGTIQWMLGFSISICLILHPLTFLVHSLFCRFVSPRYRKDKTGLRALADACPRTLDAAQRQHGGSQDPGLLTFLIRWRDKGGCQQTGSMKLFTPQTQEKWRNEVNAITRIGALAHPNVAPYLWVSPANAFSSFLHTSTRLNLSKRSMLVCRLHYPSGNLHTFLQNRIHQMTEIGLHKITLDIASGLEHIHQQNLVHNGLTSQSVYMASVSEKIGLKAVIGDLENCYEVPADSRNGSNHVKLPTAKPWTSGSQLPDLFSITGRIEMGANLTNNRFAPDIRSFGMVVLEMLMALTEFNQKKRTRLKVSSRATNESRHSLHSFDDIPQRSAMTEIKGTTSTCSTTDPDIPELPAVIGTNPAGHHPHHHHPHHHDHHHHASGEPCTCSSNVTNIRAVKKGSNSKHSRYSFQLDSALSKYQIQNRHHIPGEAGKQIASDIASLDSIDEVDLQATSEKPLHIPPIPAARKRVYTKQVVANSDHWKKPRAWEIDHGQQREITIAVHQPMASSSSRDVSQESICPHSEYSPRSDHTSTSASSHDITSDIKSKKTEENVKTAALSRLQNILPLPPPRRTSSVGSENSNDCETDDSGSNTNMYGPTSPRRTGNRNQIVTNGTFLTPRSTPEIRPPSRPRKVPAPPQSDACTDTADFVEFDSSESLAPSTGTAADSLPDATVDLDVAEDVITKAGNGSDSTNTDIPTDQPASSNNKQFYSNGFQTIYEEEQQQDGAIKVSEKDVIKRKMAKLPVSRRRLPPLPPTTEQTGGNQQISATEAARKKRNSMASLDESVVSFDSGVGSSVHYDLSDQSSVYFSNVPGTRQPFYMSENGGSTVQKDGDSEAYGSVHLSSKRHTSRTQDSGIDSSADSCDEPSKEVRDILSASNTKLRKRLHSDEALEEENVYEVVADNTGRGLVVKKKKPCIGHHEGVGHSCCAALPPDTTDLDRSTHKRTSTNSKTKAGSKPRDQSPQKSKQEVMGGSNRKSFSKQDTSADIVNGKLSPSRQQKEPEDAKASSVEAQWKKLVDTATNTSDHDDSSSFDEEIRTINEHHHPQAQTRHHSQVVKQQPQQQHPMTTPVFTKLEAALLDELLEMRQQENASRGAETILADIEHEACASQCLTCKRHVYNKRQTTEVGGYLQPLPSRTRRLPRGGGGGQVSSTSNSFKLSTTSSSKSSSPSSLLYHSSLSSGDNVSYYSGDGSQVAASPASISSGGRPKAGVGYRQLAQMQQLLQPRGLPGNNQEMQRLLDGVQKQGNLGYIAGQLVPLLSECWTEDQVPTADDILHKLCEVLPTAAV